MFNKLRDKALLNIVSVKEKAGAKKDLQVPLLTIVCVGVGWGGPSESRSRARWRLRRRPMMWGYR